VEKKDLMKRIKELEVQRDIICKRRDSEALTKIEDEIFSICRERYALNSSETRSMQ